MLHNKYYAWILSYELDPYTQACDQTYQYPVTIKKSANHPADLFNLSTEAWVIPFH